MKKVKIPLVIAIIILIIVFFNSIYVLVNADREITDNVLGLIILGLLVITIISAIAIVKIYKKEEIKPEKALLIIMPIFCILFSIVMPIGRGPDELVHWYKAFDISQGNLISSTTINDFVAVELPYRSTKYSGKKGKRCY